MGVHSERYLLRRNLGVQLVDGRFVMTRIRDLDKYSVLFAGFS